MTIFWPIKTRSWPIAMGQKFINEIRFLYIIIPLAH